MLRGCLLSLVMLAGIIVGYFYWLDSTFDRPASYWASGIIGFVTLLCIGALMNGVRAWRDARRIGAALHMDLQLVEGRTVTVCGTIHPLGEPLVAPFSQVPCIACEYDLTSVAKVQAANDEQTTGSDFAGFWMNPCVIRTPFRDVKLIGFPLLEGFGEQRIYSYSAAGHARQFLLDNEFEDRTGLKMVSVLSAFGDVWADDDGHVRKNIRIGNVKVDEIFPPELMADVDEINRLGLEDENAIDDEEEEDDEDDEGDEGLRNRAPLPKMVEKRVGIGEKVCAIGVYDEVRGGLVPLSRGGQPNRLIRGDVESIVTKSGQSMRANLLGGVFFLGLAHAILLGVMFIYTHSDDVIRDRQRVATNAVSKADTTVLRELFRRGFDPNFGDSNQDTLLHHSQSAEVTALLLQHGANPNAKNDWGSTPLHEAARYGRVEVVKALLAGGADRGAKNHVGQTAADNALSHAHFDVARLIDPSAN